MSDRDFIKTFSGLLAALVALTVIIFVVAQMVSGAGKIKTAQNDSSQIAERIKPVGELAMAGVAAVANGVISTANAADKGEALYNATCMACHAAGVAGAPKIGDKAAWAPRIAQGMDTLHTHAIKGFQGKKGMMPPKGGSSAPDDDVKAAVDYMVGKSK